MRKQPTYDFTLAMKTPFLLGFAAAGLLFASASSGEAQPYAVTTLAGAAGQEPSLGQNGDGTNNNSRFFSPYGLAVDPAGNVYVADGNSIRVVAPVGTNWVTTTLAGQGLRIGSVDGIGTNALFDDPQGIAVGSPGNLYVADTVNNSIRKVSLVGTNWVVATLAGSSNRDVYGSADGTNGNARFYQPQGIAVDTGGNLYVADTLNNTIRKVSSVGTNWVVSTLAGLAGTNGSADGTNKAARFNGPVAIAADTNGNLYVADFNNNTIRKITPAGTNWVVSTLAGLAGSGGSADGTNSAARFNLPDGVAVDGAGNLYVSDSGNNTIRKLKPVGTNWVVTSLAGMVGATGSANGVGNSALFNVPYGIGVDAAGSLYISDSANYTIRQGHLAAWVQIMLTGKKVVLSWPTALTGYVCVASSNLAGPWVLDTNATGISGDYVVQTNNVLPGNGLFRLRKP